ncbi:helix-turn-helix domain-containing protein [Microbulbifer sp.]|uniref:AraC family transcriptional regulator n=1 Tax=Microbulbifer sp. TaxID=1908541 RepID=UPI002F93CCFF
MLLTQEITLHLTSLVILFGIATGFTLALLLFMAPWGNRRANRCLGALLAICTLWALVYVPIIEVETLSASFHAIFALQLLFGPLLYFYCRLLTEPGFRWQRQHLWHLAPALASALVWLWQLYIESPCLGAGECIASEVTHARFVHRAAAISSAIIYSSWVLRLLRPYQRRVRESYSNIEPVDLSWLRGLSFTFLAIAAACIPLEVYGWLVPARELTPGMLQSLAPLIMSVVLGWFGLRQRIIQLSAEGPGEHEDEAEPKGDEVNTPADSTSANRKPTVRNLSESAAEALWQQLQHVMQQQKPYLEPGLKIAQLAQRLDVPAHHLSETINGIAGQSFYDFINQYRVEEAAQLLADQANGHWSVTEIGLQAGFNSNSTFFSQFKKRLGESPSRYRSHENKSVTC